MDRSRNVQCIPRLCTLFWLIRKSSKDMGADRNVQCMPRHYGDVIMTTIASQITSLTVVYSIVYSDADQRKHQSSASLAFVWGIHRDRWIPAQRVSYAENVSIWWRHHGLCTVFWFIRKSSGDMGTFIQCLSSVEYIVLGFLLFITSKVTSSYDSCGVLDYC